MTFAIMRLVGVKASVPCDEVMSDKWYEDETEENVDESRHKECLLLDLLQ